MNLTIKKVTTNTFAKRRGLSWILIGLCYIMVGYTYQTTPFEPAPRGESALIDSLIQLSRETHRENHDEAYEYRLAQEAVDRALETNDTLLYARALDNLGLLYRYHQRYNEAIPFHRKAYDLVKDRRHVTPLYKMIFANNAGLAARYNEQFDLAVSYYLQALALAEKEQDLKNISIASNGLGNALSSIPDREEEALTYFERALKTEEQRNDSLGMAMNILSISDYYIKKKQHGKALKYLDRLMEINTKRNDLFGIAITNEFYGHAYLSEEKDLDKARRYYAEALRFYTKERDFLKSADILYSIGSLQEVLGKPTEALYYYDRSIRIADSLANKSLIMKNAYQIADIKEQQGDYETALQFYKRGNAFEDSINIARQKVQITALNSQYKLGQKESEIELLQKEKDLRKKKIANQEKKILVHRTYLLLLFVIAVFTAILIFIGQRNKKAKQEAEHKLIETEYERNMAQAEILISRMQINPHFISNSLNAIKLLIQKQEHKKAIQYLTAFSRFMRMVLEMPKNESISLEEELHLIRHYLFLEQKRFDQDFDFNIYIATDCNVAEIRIPPLLLQPFVENAIWHGLLPSDKSRKALDIDIYREPIDNKIVISIEDNGIGRKTAEQLKPDKTGRKSLGMKITQERILQFNKIGDCLLSMQIIDKKNGAGTKIILTLDNQEIGKVNNI